MKPSLKRPLIVFFATVLVIAIILCGFPINLFDGVTIYQQGNGTVAVPMKMSLSYFFPWGIDESDMQGVIEFYLIGKGYAVMFVVLIGLPGLVAYRSFLKQKIGTNSTK